MENWLSIADIMALLYWRWDCSIIFGPSDWDPALPMVATAYIIGENIFIEVPQCLFWFPHRKNRPLIQ
jgi:hypothetical protein